MKTISGIKLLFLTFLVLISYKTSYPKEKVILVIIDGLRHSEGLGDPNHTYVPEMWQLAQQGTYISNFQNDKYTYTSRAVPTIWCGTWTDVVDTTYNGKSTQYSNSPSIWEYIRKQKNLPAKKCSYILKYVSSLWLPSFDHDYGPDYWPEFYSSGSSDVDVYENARSILKQDQPEFAVVYFADVDHAGHSGNWQYYTSSIGTADMLVGHLWEELQNDPFYKDSTTMIVTNDHGRHDDIHGGFQGHGDGCQGCRQIQFLAIGPNIKKNHRSSIPGILPDVAVTAASILGVNCPMATGRVLEELFIETSVENLENSGSNLKVISSYPNPFSSNISIEVQQKAAMAISWTIYDAAGKQVYSESKPLFNMGNNILTWDGKKSNGNQAKPGLYYYTISNLEEKTSGKIVFLGK